MSGVSFLAKNFFLVEHGLVDMKNSFLTIWFVCNKLGTPPTRRIMPQDKAD